MKPNPIVQIIYFILVIGIFISYHFYGIVYFDNLLNSFKINTFYLLYSSLFVCVYYFYKCCLVNSGIITINNQYVLYNQRINSNYNKSLYGMFELQDIYNPSEKQVCTKCNVIKIPRSKHCNICDKCIDLYDHHCVWINQCVGSNNYKYFIKFLVSHIITTFVLVLFGLYAIYRFILEKKLFDAKFYNKSNGVYVSASYQIIFKYFFYNYYAFISNLIILFVIFIILLLFTAYHCYLMYNNKTSYEDNKIKRYKKYFNSIEKSLLEYINNKTNEDNTKIEENNNSKSSNDILYSGYKKYIKDKVLSRDEYNKYKSICLEPDKNNIEDLSTIEIVELYIFVKQYLKDL